MIGGGCIAAVGGSEAVKNIKMTSIGKYKNIDWEFIWIKDLKL